MQQLPRRRRWSASQWLPLVGAALGGAVVVWQLSRVGLPGLALADAAAGARMAAAGWLLTLGVLAAMWLWAERDE